MVWIQKHLYSWPIFSLKGLHQEVLSGVPWCLQVTKTSLCSVWFLPCNNVTVLKPLFYAEWVTTAYRSPSSMSASWNLHRWKHYLQKFPKSLACKISWPESMWFLAVRILKGSCLPRTCSISGWSDDKYRHVSQIPRELLWATIHHAILRMQHVVETSGARIENIL